MIGEFELNVFDLLRFFEEKIESHYAKRTQTEHYYSLIREQILLRKQPLAPVRPIYNALISDKGCKFTYQYFNKIVEQQWNVVLLGNQRHIVVASERDRLCSW